MSFSNLCCDLWQAKMGLRQFSSYELTYWVRSFLSTQSLRFSVDISFHRWCSLQRTRSFFLCEMVISNLKTYICHSYWGRLNSKRKFRSTYVICFLIFSSPINDHTFLGWIFSFCIRTSFGYIYLLVNVSTLTFMVAMGLYFKACTHHFRMILTEIADENSTIGMRLKIKSSIIAAVEFHKTTKRYVYSRHTYSQVFTTCIQAMRE